MIQQAVSWAARASFQAASREVRQFSKVGRKVFQVKDRHKVHIQEGERQGNCEERSCG